MADPTDTTDVDDGADSLWMVCRPGGEQIVRWRDLTEAEQQDAIRHHNKIYGIET
ncbi:hypothetical protein V1294_006035 [Bradyrhizobium sp. AZCC 1678]|uniref:hypothetical protein n=1 Tax=Bradyrhizobium sp. AZCC 1678 TaxID=3117030 RepID=UPI002FF0CD50